MPLAFFRRLASLASRLRSAALRCREHCSLLSPASAFKSPVGRPAGRRQSCHFDLISPFFPLAGREAVSTLKSVLSLMLIFSFARKAINSETIALISFKIVFFFVFSFCFDF